MHVIRGLVGKVLQVIDALRVVLVADDPLLCECADDRWCVDCSLAGPVDGLRPWPAPVDPAA
jgi:hypothetical protein